MMYYLILKKQNQEKEENEFHGVGGPISVSDQRIKLKLLDTFMDAAEEFEYKNKRL